jgi:hypothetical protein
MLRRYYGLIEAGDYAGAWAMRSGDRAGLERFSANFRSYDRYHASVGQPSEPVESGGWAYVEVPVMITGRIRGGEPFASSGSVSLRRATSARGARAREREWHIYTGG